MCLAVPMQLTEVRDDGAAGVAEVEGARYDVNLSLIDDPRVGDYVIIHAGFAIERLDVNEANERLELFAAWAAAERESS
ncbi:MAG: HypC/HybG/HupF family hydrogenase formation chaperone [Deltaproteobacteria bacterium]|nr:HypC/HybG/HupF family hydrogenase formation chaperone [Deltaproteobacteria bacterium]